MRSSDQKAERRIRMYLYIRNHILMHCEAPTVREIMQGVRVRGTATVQEDVKWLIKKGKLAKTKHRPLRYTLPVLKRAAAKIAERVAEKDKRSGLAGYLETIERPG